MNNPESAHSSDQDIVEHKVRRAAGINALKKIGVIVTDDLKEEADKEKTLRWFFRYGWIILLAGLLLVAYVMGLI